MAYDNQGRTTSSGGCGCLSLILGILAVWALFFGVPTSWGELNIDLFPPGIYLEGGK